jgi:streptomycin 6-kinase
VSKSLVPLYIGQKGKKYATLRYDTVEVENQLKVQGKRVETNLVTGNLTSKVINIYETKNPSTLPSVSSILIYFQSLIQSEASDSQLALLAARNSQLAK